MGRAYVDASELFFGRDPALHQFADLGIDLSQFLSDFAGQIAIDLNDLKFSFRDLALRLRAVR